MKLLRISLAGLMLLLGQACQPSVSNEHLEVTPVVSDKYNTEGNLTLDIPLDTTTFKGGVPLPLLKADAANEISGLASSVRQPSTLWGHNDSGDKARLFLFDTLGNLVTTLKLEGKKNRDWEDIALNVEDGAPYLYVAEIGDNRAKYDDKYLYRFPEPAVTDAKTSVAEADIQTIHFRYEDGARDAETLLIDPLTRDIVIVTKREDRSRVYELTYPYRTDTVNIIRFKGELPFRMAVGGDVAPNGREILVKNYDHIFYWVRNEGETLSEALLRTPVRLPYEREVQGEAIAWSHDAQAYYTVTEEEEGNEAGMWVYRRK